MQVHTHIRRVIRGWLSIDLHRKRWGKAHGLFAETEPRTHYVVRPDFPIFCLVAHKLLEHVLWEQAKQGVRVPTTVTDKRGLG